MKILHSFTLNSGKQVKSFIPVLLTSYLLLLLLFISVAITSNYYQVPISLFTSDPASALNGHPFTGVISNIGILFWCATAAICFFSSAIQWISKESINSKFLFFSGLITSLLLFDDLFMLHEVFIPKYLQASEIVVYSVYLILVLTYFIKFRKIILKTEYALLILALSFFMLSIVSDIFSQEKDLEYLIEDGFKLFGIVTWFLFYIRTCFIHTRKILRIKYQE